MLLIPWISYAQEWDQPSDDIVCESLTPHIIGNTALLEDTAQDFAVDIESDEEVGTQSFVLSQWEEILMNSSGANFAYNFTTLWSYDLQATMILVNGCTYTTQTTIDVHTSLITYIGPESEEITLGHEWLTNSGTAIHEIVIKDISSLRSEQLTALLVEHAYYVQHADTLLLDGEVIGPLFEMLDTLQQLVGLELEDIQLYVLASINQSAFRRMIATYRDLLGVDKISVIPRQYIGSLLTSLLLQKNPEQLSFVKTYNVGLASSNKFLPISYIVDYLLYNDFPIGALLFILLLPILVVLVSLFRQVIGLSVFGVFYPLFFAFSLHILWIIPTIIFFVAAFITTMLLWVFTKRIYLLYSAKIALMVVLYCLVTLICLRAVHVIDPSLIDFGLFQNYYFLFPFLLLLVVGSRVFTEQFYLFDRGRWIWLLEFVLVSMVMYWAISSQYLQNALLGLPEISLICLVLIILIGRFTGLQLLEYVRFMPLIKHYFEEEEE